MFGILLLIAAAFSGGEVVSQAVSDPTTAPPAVAAPATPLETQAESPVPAEAAAPTTVAADADAVPEPTPLPVPAGPHLGAADRTAVLGDDPDLAALRLVSDFYDTAPPAAVPAAPARPVLGPHLVRSNEYYEADGRKILVEVLRPDDDARRPAVLILHGASGIGDGTFYRNAAEIFAERGYVTYLPHYLADRHAAKQAAPKPAAKAAKTKGGKAAKTVTASAEPGSIRADFTGQEHVLRAALDYMAKSSYVDSSRLGVFGMSLGGFHALALSSKDYRIQAVVDMSGALRGNTMPDSNHLPPILALHGARDSIIPVARARSLAGELAKRGIPHELKVYPDQGHFFRGKAQEDALQRSAGFFNTYLTPSESTRAVRSGDATK
jgi:dienelactone hydrolase